MQCDRKRRTKISVEAYYVAFDGNVSVGCSDYKILDDGSIFWH